MMTQQVLEICKAGLEAWQQAFNQHNAIGCADQYTEDSTMVTQPFGTFVGRDKIQAFWKDIIDQKFSNVAYHDIQWKAETADSYILTSKWTMNKAFGIVHKEHWKVQSDGKARLIYDHFEVLGEK